MGGAKVGYAHSTMSRDGDRVETSIKFQMKIGRVDNPVTLHMVQGTTESLDGAALGFQSEMNLSVMKSAMRGTVKDGKITIVTTQYNMDQTQVFDLPAGALMSWGLFREQMLRGDKPGTKYTLKTYAPELRLDDAVSAVIAIGDMEDFTVRGKTARGQKVVVTLESPAGSYEMISWVDKSGLPVRSRVPMPGVGDMEMIAADQATALADFVPPEIFMSTVVKAGRKIDRDAARKIRYRVRAKDANGTLETIPDTGAQKVVGRDKQSVELVVSRMSHVSSEPGAQATGGPSEPGASATQSEPQAPARGQSEPGASATGNQNRDRQAEGDQDGSPKDSLPSSQGGTKGGSSPVSAADLAEYLESNLMINTSDLKLVELAKEAAGGEKEPFTLGDKLRCFVTEYVSTKSLNVGFATASEVARTKEGDCSEHGVLLAALGRINGLPSRVAVGLAYVPVFGNQDDIFGYHMWTQFYIGGRWVDFDAALRETDCSPTRIAFAVSSLKNAGMADLSLPLINKIGAIDIDILDIETTPKSEPQP
ncbi:MAG: transglutaminase-like domain-containing protein [Planctomycetota bacterium]